MQQKIELMQNNLLDENYELYNILSSNKAPKWWNEIKNDPQLYIEIRKGNIIDVYYEGGRMAEIKYNGRTKSIHATAHPKYMGYINKADSKYYRLNNQGKYSAIYQDVESYLVSNKKRNILKSNIVEFYSKPSKGENESEKSIQSRLRLDSNNCYIDTEFAYRLYSEVQSTIRFDLVKVENNKIIIEELKRIGDARLNVEDGKPEVIEQMFNYSKFIEVNQCAIIQYYKLLIQIKKNLELPLPLDIDVNQLQLELKPKLIIANNYAKSTVGREKRIQQIEENLMNIEHRYI